MRTAEGAIKTACSTVKPKTHGMGISPIHGGGFLNRMGGLFQHGRSIFGHGHEN